MEDGLWDESSWRAKWIHGKECAKCLRQEAVVKQNVKAGESMVYSQSL